MGVTLKLWKEHVLAFMKLVCRLLSTFNITYYWRKCSKRVVNLYLCFRFFCMWAEWSGWEFHSSLSRLLSRSLSTLVWSPPTPLHTCSTLTCVCTSDTPHSAQIRPINSKKKKKNDWGKKKKEMLFSWYCPAIVIIACWPSEHKHLCLKTHQVLHCCLVVNYNLMSSWSNQSASLWQMLHITTYS